MAARSDNTSNNLPRAPSPPIDTNLVAATASNTAEFAPGLTCDFNFDFAQAMEEIRDNLEPSQFDPLGNEELQARCEHLQDYNGKDFDARSESDDNSESAAGSALEKECNEEKSLSSVTYLLLWFVDDIWTEEIGMPLSPWLIVLDSIKRVACADHLAFVNENDALVDHTRFFKRAAEYEHGVLQYLSGAWRSDALLPKVWPVAADATLFQAGGWIPEEDPTAE